MKTFSEIKRLVQERLSDEEKTDSEKVLSDEEVRNLIYLTLAEEQKSNFIDVRERAKLGKKLFDSLRGLDVLQPLAEDEAVTDIMVNGADSIFYEKNGKMYRWLESFDSEERLREVILQLAGSVNRRINERTPVTDAKLPDGSRMNAVLPPIAQGGAILTIRRFSPQPIGMETWLSQGGITEECAAFLRVAVREKYNIFVCGGTSSGKTTFLNMLSEFIPEDERIVTIEDTAELRLTHCPNLVSLQARPADEEGTPAVTIRDLIKTSLRMRPDRIIVGEIRGAEALDMLQAMNTGHEGSLSTGHANSCEDMLSRVETMVMMGSEMPLKAVRAQIASALDLMVFLCKGRDGKRKVAEIVQIRGGKEGYETEKLFERVDGELLRTDKELWKKRSFG